MADRLGWALAAGVLVAAGWPPAGRAHPVRIGRYTEIPYGIRPDHPVPTQSGGDRRTGRLVGAVPEAEPALLFNRSLRHRRPRGPTIAADGTLYIGSMGGLTALDPDGNERWTAAVGAVHAAPSLAPSDDVVVVTRGGLVAVVTPEGVVRQSADLGAPARGSPLVLDDGSVLVGTIDRRVHRLDANLRRVFDVELADGTAGALSRTGRGVLAVTAGRLLTLLTPEGNLLRQVGLGGRTTAPATIADDGTLWVPTTEGVVYAIEPNGRVRARTELGSRHYDGAAPALGHDGALRVPTLSEGLVCLGPGGTERWRLANPNGFNAPASIGTDDTTLVVDRAGRMLAVDRDGVERWRVVLSTYSFSEPVMGADGTIYVATERGALQAFR